jgi:FtsH-binding integral membrane protein
VSWIRNLGILLVAILGIVLFLYGANHYNDVIGWTGVFLFFAAIIVYVVWEIFEALRKRRS